MDDEHERLRGRPSEWAKLHGWVKLLEELIRRAGEGREVFFDVVSGESVESDPAWVENPQALFDRTEPHVRFLITQEGLVMAEEGDLVPGDKDDDCMERDEYFAYLERVIEHLNSELGEGKFVFSDRLRSHLVESQAIGVGLHDGRRADGQSAPRCLVRGTVMN